VTGARYKMTQVTIGNAECPTLGFLERWDSRPYPVWVFLRNPEASLVSRGRSFSSPTRFAKCENDGHPAGNEMQVLSAMEAMEFLGYPVRLTTAFEVTVIWIPSDGEETHSFALHTQNAHECGTAHPQAQFRMATCKRASVLIAMSVHASQMTISSCRLSVAVGALALQ